MGMQGQGMGRPGMGGPGMGMQGQGMGRPGMGGPGMGMQGQGMGRPGMGGPGMGMQGQGMGRPGMGGPGMGMQGQGMGRPGTGMGGPGMGMQGQGMGRPGTGMGRPGGRYNIQINRWNNNEGLNESQKLHVEVNKKIREQKLWQTDLDKFYREKGGDRSVRSTLDGNKKALFIGINYTGTSAELKGCINDVKNVSQLVCQRFGFQNCLYLTDEQQDSSKKPTYNNIIEGMKWLVQGAKSGDSLFFHYSGHGGTAKDGDGDEVDGYDETIIPLDYESAGQITDDIIYENLVTPLPQGCRLTAIFDSCHSGTVLDLPYTYQCDGQVEVIENDVRKEVFKKAINIVGSLISGDQAKIASSLLSIFDGSINFAQLASGLSGGSYSSGNSSANQNAINKRKHDADVIQFSGCRDDQTSADAKINNVSTGAMSYALITVLNQNPNLTYTQLLTNIRQVMKEKRFSQIPQLSTSHPMNMNEIFKI
ncbi:hypothetical protein BCR36DRAFT_585208 [Piromyces finnis]|uniref:Peptidase C14 caspase domain-containing protein n=1 Tax=Piromyces finnis TaxID=1754191 RepID=A0A1Y1V4B7_9FUNG|nr:hypothetical protein BCR36DRAFT_585208 [Piromyces finnis]|eukprot:ORX46391.1 hypothetical protein BCR36DRAFT_585208 [Piromyces finnis]